MKITQIKQQVKRPDRVSIFVDNTYAFSLTYDQLLAERLTKDMDMDEVRLTQLKKLSNEGALKAKALEWLMLRPHATQELREYGYRKKIDQDLLESWIEEFQAKNYLDDEAFAQWFAENRLRKNKSRRAIAAELTTKGIGREVSDRILQELQGDDDESLRQLITKLRTKPRYKDDQKLVAYLVGKGFRYADVRRILELGA